MKFGSKGFSLGQNGKGSKPRPTKIKKYKSNYESINWNKSVKKNKS